MKKFIPKHRWQNVVFSKFAVVLLAIMVLFAGNATWNMYQKYTESRKYKNQALLKLSELEERKASLIYDIGKLETERGMEEELRKRFGIVKEGEDVVVIIDDPELNADVESSKKTEGFWHKILNIFR